MAPDDDIVIEDGSEIQEGESIFGAIDPLVDLEEIEKSDADFQEELDSQYNETFDFGKSWSFDFAKGEFNKRGDRQVEVTEEEASFAQWCMMVLHTERGEAIVFSDDIGIETADIVSGEVPAGVVSGLIQERIEDALSVHNRFESMDNFEFSRSGSVATVSFTVTTTAANAVPIETEIRIA